MKHPQSLYLARTILSSPYRYSLRVSFWDENEHSYRFREIANLSEDPGIHIIYPNEHCFYVNESLNDLVTEKCGHDFSNELEKLLWPFVTASVKRKMEPFFNRGQGVHSTPVSKEEKKAIGRDIHIFDKRRLYFLRYGSVDQSRLASMSPRLCRKLLGKSRDEIEQFFIAQEQNLYEQEVKLYLFAAFNLQQHFSESYARSMPNALNEELVDDFFLEAICRLDDDKIFWKGMTAGNSLSPYLARYVIYFFDLSFAHTDPAREYARQFRNSHRQFRWPEKKSMGEDEISKIFGETADTLRQMNTKDLTSLWRRKAKELHPDIGGEHEEFVRLTAAYKELRRSK
ncbi:MAG: hypothetical protein H8E41_03080 [Desulfobulbaceae bacterium]|uniref:J domain-containing protein n=1 Tax=Candidatus Desulfobia pelagia TaxID=2841692 RepID=A0A8J6N960_9BACT|nr:hypothetical protein [Candidatus Desulfobia pelagia]